ncbi:MAG: DUF1801 domain-containing protein [Roseibium album]|uniref:YdhG-like domain-containing protein n=1 Tax=Roseibium album TaxID=311410 RepID=A0A0M6Z5A3_9HYPH|nr:DUF1801 domain-containing protein [Roseibium album]MBG6175894.1 uncharacterized protein YdhG (YjbR/CyaY superfamily) [Labrenzia sp. EL_132]MBG6230345.1 uncharacterized protein YdhG (YjbR/CyaY superfamily) [Labrenzia sp. EL_208]CTQ57320.1 hypothetical protein LA5094_00074 [Roseibium album]CTQ69855.1 hypothetical protein LA5095_01817 [Roseibium album]CTQ71832.1 hypothetical protein LA5096_03071 [Roseibium album]
MQYDVKTPDEYLQKIEDDWRRTSLLQLRALILAAAPDVVESIHYKMLGYALDGDFVFHLNAQRNYVSLYAGDAARIDPEGALLKGLSVGKGCVRFSKSKSVTDSRIVEFIERAVVLKRQGIDFSC